MPPIRRVSTGEADAAQVERERVEAVVASRLLLVLAVAGAAIVGAATHGHHAEHFAEQSAPFEAEVGEVPSSHWLPFQEGGGRRPVPAGHNRRYAFALNLRGVCFACGHTADWGHVPVPRLSADLHPE